MTTKDGIVQIGSHPATDREMISEAIDCLCHALESFDLISNPELLKHKLACENMYKAIAEIIFKAEKLEIEMFCEEK